MSLSRILLAVALVDASLGLAVVLGLGLVRRGRLHLGLVDVVAGSCVALAAGAVQAVTLLEDRFARVHLAYLVLVVGLPALGAVVGACWLAARRRPRIRVTGPAAVGATALLALGAAGLWGTHVEPFRLRTDRARLDLAQLDAGDPELRVGVLADLQTRRIGDHEWAAVRRLNQADVDVVLLPGDFIQGDQAVLRRELPELQRLLGALEAPGGVFLVAGDADSPERLDVIVSGTDLRALDDEVESITVDGTRVWIGGLRVEYDRPSSVETLAELARSGSREDVRILLAHRPDAGFRAAEHEEIDLVVAGHTHGGQISVPFLGPPVILSDVPRQVGAGGLHDLDGQAIYVGTGVGLERAAAPQVRFLVRPSVGVVTIR